MDSYAGIDWASRVHALWVVDRDGETLADEPFPHTEARSRGDRDAANLMFTLISSRYERGSMIVTSNEPFSAWGEILGEETVAAAMIDRLVHHAEILAMSGDSYRLKDKKLALVQVLADRAA